MQQAVCPPEDPSPTAFRAAEKRFKRPPPGKRKNLRKRKAKQEHQDNISLCPSDVLDCHDPEGLSKFVHSRVVKAIKGESDQLIHELRSHPGFFVAPKVLTADERYAFLLDVSGPLLEPPATTNLSALHGRLQGLWKASEEDLAVHSQPEQKPQHCSVGSCALAHGKTEARRAQNQKMIDDSSATSCRYEQMQSSHMQLVPQPSTWAASRDADSISARQLLKKVKWATIGPRYDWSDRRYDSSSPCRQLPRFAAAAAQRISGLVSSGQNADEADTDGYGRCHNGTMVCPLSAAAAEPTSRSDCSTEHLNLRQSSNAVVSMQQGSSLVHQARPTGSASIQHQQPGGDTRGDTRSVLTQQHRPFQPDAALVCFYRAAHRQLVPRMLRGAIGGWPRPQQQASSITASPR